MCNIGDARLCYTCKQNAKFEKYSFKTVGLTGYTKCVLILAVTNEGTYKWMKEQTNWHSWAGTRPAYTCYTIGGTGKDIHSP